MAIQGRMNVRAVSAYHYPQRLVRALGGRAARAAFGGNLSLTWLSPRRRPPQPHDRLGDLPGILVTLATSTPGPRPPLSDMFRRSATSWCIVAGDVAVLAGCWRLGRRKVLLVARNR